MARWKELCKGLDMEKIAFFPAAATHEERVTDIEHLVDQIEHQLFHEPIADDRHQHWHDQKRQIRSLVRTQAFKQCEENRLPMLRLVGTRT